MAEIVLLVANIFLYLALLEGVFLKPLPVSLSSRTVSTEGATSGNEG